MGTLSLLLEWFPVQQVIYLEITFSNYVYPLMVIYFLKVLNSFTADSPIRPSLTNRFFESHSSQDNILMNAYRQQNLRLKVESSRLSQIYPTIPFLVLLMLYPLLWTGTVLFVATPSYPPEVPMMRAYCCVKNTFIHVKTTLETKCVICVHWKFSLTARVSKNHATAT